MIRQYLCISLVMIVGLVFIDMSDATVYYMGGPGDDFQNLSEAFNGPNAMQGGDTLIIRDGVYAGDANTILSGTVRQPPNGTPGNYTTVKAENLGGVIFTVPIKIVGPVTRNSYWEFEGIKWASYVNLYGNHHVKFLRCAFEGDVWDGNSVAFGTNSAHHLLLEDCIAYGKGRYKFLIYLSSEVILRRCVARQDYANRNIDSSMPIAVFSIYGSRNVECQNCISIDGDQPQYWHTSPTEFGGAFYAPGRGEARWRGCIALNMAMGGGSANDVDNPFENTIVWRAVTGLPDFRSSGTTFEHITIGNLVEPGEMGVVPSQVKFNGGTGIGVGRSITKVSNSIITDAYSVAINSTSLGGNVLYNNIANGNIIDTDTTDVNPLYDPIANPNGALRYLVRIEEGSSLKGTATDGGDIGANVLKRIGQSGTLYGELGYDEITEENLWPWPYEDWIKEQMGNYNRGGIDPQLPRGDRGFAAYQSPFGSPNTLTSYIWEYLGNPIPPEIYGAVPLTITTTSLPNGTVNQAYSTALEAIGGNAPYAWSVISGSLSDGLALHSSSGLISGTPTTEGVSSFAVKVQDSGLPPDTAIKDLSIAAQLPANVPPELTPIGSKIVNEEDLLQFTVTATDSDGDSLSLSCTNIPAGATYTDNGNGTGLFSWTPTYEQAGIYSNVHFEASDGELADSEDITITVNNVNRPPLLDPIGDKAIGAGHLLQFTVSAIDPDGDSLSLSCTNVPAGAAFTDNGNGTGLFSWTPTHEQAGTYTNVHFEASDGELADSEDINITVSPTLTKPGRPQHIDD